MTNLNVLTWNLYLGAEISHVLNVPPAELPHRMSALWSMVQATDFPARGNAIAAQIAALEPEWQPDVILLQEAFRWSIVSPVVSPGPTPATLTVYDYAPYLMGGLAARGLQYIPGAIGPGLSATISTAEGKQICMADSVAILVRANGPRRIVRSNPQHGLYKASLKVWVGDMPFAIRRPWAAVDLSVDDRFCRVVTTHLESFYPPVRQSQLNELLAGPAATSSPLLLGGDFNGPAPTDPLYQNLRQQGFQDAWPEVGAVAGQTFGHAEDLRNREVQMSERIDWLLSRGGLQSQGARVLGTDLRDRTANGLWPSDHAAVLAQLRL